MHYLFDDSFEGFLSLYSMLSESPDKLKDAFLFSEQDYQPDLFSSYELHLTNGSRAQQLAVNLEHDYGQTLLRTIMEAWFSEHPKRAQALKNYLQALALEGRKIAYDYGHQASNPILQMARSTAREAHKFMGILRFEQLEGGIYYAPIEPSHDILYLLAEHFTDRFRSQDFVIHDRSRNKGLFFNQKEWMITELKENPLRKDRDQLAFEALWKIYYDHIAIQERSNPALRRNFLPKKYWKYLPELKDATTGYDFHVK